MHFVPGMPMLLNWLQPVARREKLPADCMTHKAGTGERDPQQTGRQAAAGVMPAAAWLPAAWKMHASKRLTPYPPPRSTPSSCPAARDGKPAFAQTFFDDTAMSTFLADIFNITVLPISVYAGDTCTLAGYSECGPPPATGDDELPVGASASRGLRLTTPEPSSPSASPRAPAQCPARAAASSSTSPSQRRSCRCVRAQRCALTARTSRQEFADTLVARAHPNSLVSPCHGPSLLLSTHNPPQVGIDECPASSVPYMSVSCKGPWCSNFMRPCGKTVTNDCGLDGLVCRELFPGLIARTNTDQLTDWLMQWK